MDNEMNNFDGYKLQSNKLKQLRENGYFMFSTFSWHSTYTDQ